MSARPNSNKLDALVWAVFSRRHGDGEHLKPAAKRGLLRAIENAALLTYQPDKPDDLWKTHTLEQLAERRRA
jgi:hypothetical protein